MTERERDQECQHEPSEGSDYPAAAMPTPPRPVRVWVDLTNSPHVLVLRPVVEALRAQRRRGGGHGARLRADGRAAPSASALDVEVDRTPPRRARRGEGGRARVAGDGARRAGPARGRSRGPLRPRPRPRLERRHGRGRALLRIPRSTMFDYEWATVQHTVNCRLAQAVVVPEAIPPERLDRYGARGKLQRYPGLKEEYYLADFAPDPAVLDELGLDAGAADRGRPHAARGLALPPLRALAVRRRPRPPARAGPGRRPAPDARAARRARAGGRVHRPRARDRRAVAHRLRRPRRERRRAR